MALWCFRKDFIAEDFVEYISEALWKGPTKAEEVVFVLMEFKNA